MEKTERGLRVCEEISKISASEIEMDGIETEHSLSDAANVKRIGRIARLVRMIIRMKPRKKAKKKKEKEKLEVGGNEAAAGSSYTHLKEETEIEEQRESTAKERSRKTKELAITTDMNISCALELSKEMRRLEKQLRRTRLAIGKSLSNLNVAKGSTETPEDTKSLDEPSTMEMKDTEEEIAKRRKAKEAKNKSRHKKKSKAKRDVPVEVKRHSRQRRSNGNKSTQDIVSAGNNNSQEEQDKVENVPAEDEGESTATVEELSKLQEFPETSGISRSQESSIGECSTTSEQSKREEKSETSPDETKFSSVENRSTESQESSSDEASCEENEISSMDSPSKDDDDSP